MFQSVRRWSNWTQTAAALAALFTVSAQANPQQIYRKILPSVMTLEVEAQSGRHFVGCAVMVLADDTALTAWHVVNDARSVWAVFEDGTRVKVLGWVDVDSQRDLTL